MSLAAPRGDPTEPLHSLRAAMTGAWFGVDTVASIALSPRISADTGVAVARSLFLVAVDFGDGVIDVDVLAGAVGRQRSLFAQAAQDPGGDGIELSDVTEGETAQERAQRRWRVSVREDFAGAAVFEQGHVIDRIRTGDHASNQGTDFRASIGILVRRHRQVPVGQLVQPGVVSEIHCRDQAGCRHEVRIIERSLWSPGGSERRASTRWPSDHCNSFFADYYFP